MSRCGKSEHAGAVLLFGAAVPSTTLQVFFCLLAHPLLAVLAALVLVQQGTGGGDFQEDHLAWMSALEVDDCLNGGIVQEGQGPVLV
jgi:hypothetical protein